MIIYICTIGTIQFVNFCKQVYNEYDGYGYGQWFGVWCLFVYVLYVYHSMGGLCCIKVRKNGNLSKYSMKVEKYDF